MKGLLALIGVCAFAASCSTAPGANQGMPNSAATGKAANTIISSEPAVSGPSLLVVDPSATLPASGGEPQESPAAEPSATLNEKHVQSISTPQAPNMTSLPPDKDKLVKLAKQDLADRLKIDLTQIALLNIMDITWPNISAGCGSSAGQILTKGRVYGYRVWLEANGAQYIYHVGEAGQVLPCPEPIPGANNPLLMTPSGPAQDPQNNEP